MPWNVPPAMNGRRFAPQASTSGRLAATGPLWPHVHSRGSSGLQVVARAARMARSSGERGRKTRRAPTPVPAPCSAVGEEEILRLNVGGTTMHTARSTLLQLPGSVLHDMFRRENEHLLSRGCDGTIFLDMDPDTFQQVLRFMREVKMRGGYRDASLSSFPQNDRPHLALLLQHLRLLNNDASGQQQQQPGQQPQQPEQQQQQLKPAKPATTVAAEQMAGKGKRKQAKATEAGQHQLGSNSVDAWRGVQQSPPVQQTTGTSSCSQGPVSKPDKGQQRRSSAESSGSSGGLASTLPGKPTQARSPFLPSLTSSSSSSSSSTPFPASAPSSPNPASLAPVPLATSSPSPAPSSPSALSQMYFIQAQRDPRRGMKISVYTEGDLANVAPSERFEVFCNVSASTTELSFTFVCRQDFDDVFLGITTREHIDRKGSVVPCFGWKANSRVCPATVDEVHGQGDGAEEEASASYLTFPSTEIRSKQDRKGGLPLWGRGDSVELIISLPSPVASATSGLTSSSSSRSSGSGHAPLLGAHAPCMVLKVNGKELERMSNLPPLHEWCWYIALELGSDMSCVSLMEDSYAVHWAEYQVKRFLS